MPRESKLIRNIIQGFPGPALVSERDDGRVLCANEHAARALGVPLNAFIGSTTIDLYDDPSARQEILELLSANGRLVEHEVRLRRANDHRFWALANCEPLTFEGKPALCTTFLDISADKKVQQAVDQARAFAEDIVATVPYPLLVLDRSLCVVSLNRAFRLSFASTENDVPGMHLSDVADGAFAHPELLERLEDVFAHDAAVSNFKTEHRFPESEPKTLLITGRKVYRPGTDINMVLLSIEDVTAAKKELDTLEARAASARSEARAWANELQETERRLMTVLRNLPGAAYRCKNDEQWTMEFMSHGCTQLTGYAPSELVGNDALSYADLIVEEDRQHVWDTVQEAVSKCQPFQLEYRIRTKSGDTKWVWEQGVALYEGDGSDIVALEGIIHDITDRRVAEQKREEIEAQMQAAQRMEAVGRLAGGIAHDFNNVLTVIKTYTGFLKEELEPGQPALEDVEMVAEAADRAARLTHQLLAFSRRQVQELEISDLNLIVGSVEKMLRRLIGEDIDLLTRLDPDLGSVKVDTSQMEQVLMNLAVNARDAMPKGGKLTIETANVTLSETYGAAKNVVVPPGEYVMMAITDTGTGIDKEIQSKIFEPFFTSKEKGKGTGLGLATVFGIVKQSGGYVWVYSEVGHGTTFKVYLPRVEDPYMPASIRSAEPVTLGGTETILLVEDEDGVRKATARILRKNGYNVIEAADGEEALTLCQDNDGIDLMLTDVVMPKLSGKDVADRAETYQPEMLVLYMSGYTNNAIVHHRVLDQNTSFLQKPFTDRALLRKIRELLDH